MEFKEIEGQSSEELRRAYLADNFSAIAGAIFERVPDCHAIVLAVAQYWADEADDAVHAELVLSRDENPDWPACAANNPFADEFGLLTAINIWDLEREMQLPMLDENSSMITAFASYCQEGSDQEMEVAQAYLPYAIARRTGQANRVDIKIVGQMLRPQWEDRFDVGFDEQGNEHASLMEPAPSRPWWKRWFGG